MTRSNVRMASLWLTPPLVLAVTLFEYQWAVAYRNSLDPVTVAAASLIACGVVGSCWPLLVPGRISGIFARKIAAAALVFILFACGSSVAGGHQHGPIGYHPGRADAVIRMVGTMSALVVASVFAVPLWRLQITDRMQRRSMVTALCFALYAFPYVGLAVLTHIGSHWEHAVRVGPSGGASF